MNNLAKHYEKEAHPFTACKSDMLAQGYSEEQASSICGAVKALIGHSAFPAPVMTCATLSKVPIFNVEGKWRGRTWTRANLDEMVKNFSALRPVLKPIIKLGHGSDQILAQQEGQPALGTLDNLRREGDTLFADFKDVPSLVVDLIRNGSYRSVSVEFYPAFEASDFASEMGDKAKGITGHVLTGLALLGAQLPAARTLPELASILAASSGMEGVEVVPSPPMRGCEAAEVWTRPNNPAETGVTMADTSDLDKRLERVRADMKADMDAALSAEREKASEAEKARKDMAAKLEAAEADKKAQDERIKALEQENAVGRVRHIRSEAEKFVAEHSTASCLKIPPTARRLAVALLSTLPSDGVAMSAEAGTELQVFSDKDTPVALSATELFKRYILACPDQKILLSEVTRAERRPNGGQPETYSEAEAAVAAREKLSLSVPENRMKVAQMVQAEFPELVAAECAPRRRA